MCVATVAARRLTVGWGYSAFDCENAEGMVSVMLMAERVVIT